MIIDALWCYLVTFELCPSCRPQTIELSKAGGASKQDTSNMDDMTVEQMAIRANQVTDEVLTHKQCILTPIVSSSDELWNFLKVSL